MAVGTQPVDPNVHSALLRQQSLQPLCQARDARGVERALEDRLLHPPTQLTEEVGELARELNHVYGPKKKKLTEEDKDIPDEIADILFTLACLANSLGLDLDLAFERVMDKHYKRDENRFERK